jgi:hypothetical protein
MKSLRPASHLLAAAILIASAGCRTAGVNNLARQDSLPPRNVESASELLVEHNRNAEKVTSLEASPSVTGKNRFRLFPGASGKLAMERPRSFRMMVSAVGTDVADIGSNDDEFWFWIKDSPEKAVYYANYDESGASPLAAGLQPELIIEAMGLRVIPDEEAAKMQVAPGKEPGTLVLTQRQKTPRGVEFFKEIVLAESTHRVLEQNVYAADHKTVLARAVVSGYKDYPVRSKSGEPDETVFLPQKIRLALSQDSLTLDVAMSEVKINRLESSRRQALFTEPHFNGFARVPLTERAGFASSTPKSKVPTSVRETMPAPPPGIRLGDPSPLGIDGARRTPRDREPSALAADLPPAYVRGVEEVVGPPIPTVADPYPLSVNANSGWRNSLSAGVER